MQDHDGNADADDGRSGVPEPLPVGYRMHDHYVIECELAPQRMGRVYRASGLAAPVAVNVLAPEFRNKDGVRRFRWLFRKAFEKHRGHVHEYGEYLGAPYVVVEYIEGVGAAIDIGEER